MSENLVPVKKETGGSTLTHGDTEYAWKKDGDTVKVPYDLALELVAAPGGGFEFADDKAAQKAAEKAEAEAPPPDAPWEPAPAVGTPAAGADERVVGGPVDRPVEQIPGRPLGKPAAKAEPAGKK